MNETTTLVGAKVAKLHLGPEGRELLAQILDGALTDAFYTILLGLALLMNVSMRRFYVSPTRTTGLLTSI